MFPFILSPERRTVREAMSLKRHVRVAMVAYANYFNDARIKNYVDALLDDGAEVDVLALGRVVDVYKKERFFFKCLGSKYPGSNPLTYVYEQLRFMAKAFWYLFVRSLNRPYDVIHVHNMPNIIALTGFPFKLAGTRVILDIHDTMPEAMATTLELSLDNPLIKLLVKEELLSAAVADKVIATNTMHKDVLVGHGISSKKILEILNVGNEKFFKPITHHSPEHEFWLGYHGTIAKRLGLLLIVEALSLLKKECPGLKFLCIGGGYDLPAMKTLAGTRGITKMIEWKPFVEVERLPDALSKVQVGIIGNLRETENKNNYMLPVKVLEYAAMEIPSVVPRLKILERYFDETAAFFYDADDANDLANTIRSLFFDRKLITTRIDGLRRFNEEYNWSTMAKRYLKMIEMLIA